MNLKGIYIDAGQLAQLAAEAERMRQAAEAQLAEIRAEDRARIDAQYLASVGASTTSPVKILDIREHLQKRYKDER